MTQFAQLLRIEHAGRTQCAREIADQCDRAEHALRRPHEARLGIAYCARGGAEQFVPAVAPGLPSAAVSNSPRGGLAERRDEP